MDAGESIALLGIITGLLLLAGGLFGAWSLGRMQAERKALEASDENDSDARLARIERAMETMALDMERLAEAQRFTARRLSAASPGADRPESSAQSPRV